MKTDKRCDAICIVRRTDKERWCQLRKDHPDTHYWERIIDGEKESVSWYGDRAFVGPPR